MAKTLTNKSCNYLLTRLLNSPSPAFSLSTTRSLETLAFEEVRASNDNPYNSTAFVLHGLLGSGRNWRSFSRNLASSLSNSSSHSDGRMVLVDLRNHGRSAEIKDLTPPHNMVNAAKDLANLVKFHGWAWPDVVIGHSMGGKVALQFAESCARGDYGDFVALPKQNSCGYWIQSLGKLTLKTVTEKWRKFCRPCRVYLLQSHHESGL